MVSDVVLGGWTPGLQCWFCDGFCWYVRYHLVLLKIRIFSFSFSSKLVVLRSSSLVSLHWFWTCSFSPILIHVHLQNFVVIFFFLSTVFVKWIEYANFRILVQCYWCWRHTYNCAGCFLKDIVGSSIPGMSTGYSSSRECLTFAEIIISCLPHTTTVFARATRHTHISRGFFTINGVDSLLFFVRSSFLPSLATNSCLLKKSTPSYIHN